MTKKHTVSLQRIEKLSPDVTSFTLAFQPGVEFHFHAGQFVMLNLHNAEKKLVRRAYSIASSPSKKNAIELCVKIYPDGKASTIFETLRGGETLDLEGPYGKFVLKDGAAEIVFIGAGAGIAPLRSMIHHLFEQKTTKKVTLFFGFRNKHDFLYQDELMKLAHQHKNFTLIVSASQPPTTTWKHDTGRINFVLQKYLKNTVSEKEFFICGPPAMVQDTKKALEELGFKKEKVYVDVWGN